MKAFALVSGGLDSILAAYLIKAQGIEVVGVYFTIPFCSRAKPGSCGCPDSVKRSADELGITLKVIPLTGDFLRILEHPSHGYGSQMNPCIDCKIVMLRKCKEMMAQENASFAITGEVLGQRPMSQHRNALFRIERDSGLKGLVVRPLCAKLLAETVPEKEGWISREKLLDFNGRGRRPQLALAGKFGLSAYATPAGGCLLTEPLFARKVRDLMRHKELNVENVELLKVGRHFRLSQHTKLVVGRDEAEGERLLGLALCGDHIFLPPADIAGATALGRGVFNDATLDLAGAILGRYFDLAENADADIVWKKYPGKEEKVVRTKVFFESQIAKYRI